MTWLGADKPCPIFSVDLRRLSPLARSMCARPTRAPTCMPTCLTFLVLCILSCITGQTCQTTLHLRFSAPTQAACNACPSACGKPRAQMHALPRHLANPSYAARLEPHCQLGNLAGGTLLAVMGRPTWPMDLRCPNIVLPRTTLMASARRPRFEGCRTSLAVVETIKTA